MENNKKITTVTIIIIIVIVVGLLGLKLFTKKTVDEGMNYAENKAIETRNDMDNDYEKEKIRLAIDLARIGENTFVDLTYEKFEQALKEEFKDEEFTLLQPDSSGIFVLKINGRTYEIDKNGNIL